MKHKKYLFALATYIGTIVGAGIFGLPYVASQSGLIAIVIYFLVITFLTLSIALLFGRVVTSTKGKHRLPGYVYIYLGNKARHVIFFTSTIGLIGVLLTYIIIGGDFLYGLFHPLLGGSVLFYTFIYFAVGSYLIFRDAKTVTRVEIIMLVFLLLLLFIFMLSGINYIKLENFLLNGPNIFLPFGALIFSLWGMSIIPELSEIMRDEKYKLKSIISSGILISVLIYLAFIFVVWGISGKTTSPEALSGLENTLGYKVILFGYFFGFLATFTSFISIGLVVKKIFWYDYKVPKNFAWFFACFIPFALYLLGMKNFIQVISITGAFALGIEGIVILILSLKTKQECAKRAAYSFNFPNFGKIFLILLLVTGVIFQIINML